MTALLKDIARHPSGRIGLIIFAIFFIAAVLGKTGLTPYDPLVQDRIARLQGPSAAHWFGTDLFGRDVLSRLMDGIGQSFIISFFSVGIASLLGAVLGLTAAWFAGLWDGVVMRFMDVLLAFPAILLALLITTIFGPGTWTSVLAIAIVLSGVAMLVLADGVTTFLQKNRMYEVLGLFILLIVGVVLLGEAGPAASHAMHDEALQIKVLGYALLPMSKTTFYFAVIVLFAVEIIQSGYSRKLAAERAHH